MAPRKPTYDWKTRDCAELDGFDVPFALKEYVQNVQGQVLKALMTREWCAWKREDMRNETPKNRELRKASLISDYPGLLTGPHGAQIRRLTAWQPWYILSARIPFDSLRQNSRNLSKDLQIALEEITALSAYNNHLDRNAKFSTFTVDGASTSRQSDYAVGEKGKGFILATQFLQEHTEKVFKILSDVPKDVKLGASFRVGHQIGTLRWKDPKYDDTEEVLYAVLEDLTPWSLDGYMDKKATEAANKKKRRRDSDDSDSDSSQPVTFTEKFRTQCSKALNKIYDDRVRFRMDAKREDKNLLSNAGRKQVSSDEVAITVVGIDGSFQPEYLFRAIYGIIPPERAWRVPGSPVQFFMAPENFNTPNVSAAAQSRATRPPRSSTPAINSLRITADRVAILRDYPGSDDLVRRYRWDLARAADLGFRTIPELGVHLALDVLSDEHSESLSHLVYPTEDADGAKAYRAAFEAALRKLHPDIPMDMQIQPTTSDSGLIKGLGLKAVMVSQSAWRIMHNSGAYLDAKDLARKVLLNRPIVRDAASYLTRLRLAMSVLAPGVPEENVTIRDYALSTPEVVFDRENNVLAFARPRPKHPEKKSCLCWLGPLVRAAATNVDDDRSEQERMDSIFRGYLKGMNGNTSVDDDGDENEDKREFGDDESANEMDVDGNEAMDEDNEEADPTYRPPKETEGSQKQKTKSRKPKSNGVPAPTHKAQTAFMNSPSEKAPPQNQQQRSSNQKPAQNKAEQEIQTDPELPRATQSQSTQTGSKPNAPSNMQANAVLSASSSDDDGDTAIAAISNEFCAEMSSLFNRSISNLVTRHEETRSELRRRIEVSTAENGVLRQKIGWWIEHSATKGEKIKVLEDKAAKLEVALTDSNAELDRIVSDRKKQLELQQRAMMEEQRLLAASEETRKRQRTE
ncbi:hypothetical protein R3P38DRAFT_3049486, partial [Favolaschia claudopus]